MGVTYDEINHLCEMADTWVTDGACRDVAEPTLTQDIIERMQEHIHNLSLRSDRADELEALVNHDATAFACGLLLTSGHEEVYVIARMLLDARYD